MIATAQPTTSSAAAPAHAPASRPLELLEARQQRDSLELLLRKEQAAMADFLVALADFDLRRGWEALGHASLFAFLHVELQLSRSATYWRLSAARLLQRFPELAEPLRDGRLCLTTTAELAKVLTEQNLAEILPRYFRLSAREAAEVTAALQPREQRPLRTVVTRLEAEQRSVGTFGTPIRPVAALALLPASVEPFEPTRTPGAVLAPEPTLTQPARGVAPRDDVEPLSADLRRIHFTANCQFLAKLDSARDGLSHAMPAATMEQVLEAALDLLLEKQARARGQVKRPRSIVPTTATAATPAMATAETPTKSTPWKPTQLKGAAKAVGAAAATPGAVQVEPDEGAEPGHRRDGPRQAIPAAVRRAVWERDGRCCSWPLDGGGRCGSTHRLELDHIRPWARDGEPTVANLRVVCHAHNTLAARRELGARCVERYRSGRRA